MRLWIYVFALVALVGLTALGHSHGMEGALPLGIASIFGFFGGAVITALANRVGRIMRPPEYMAL